MPATLDPRPTAVTGATTWRPPSTVWQPVDKDTGGSDNERFVLQLKDKESVPSHLRGCFMLAKKGRIPSTYDGHVVIIHLDKTIERQAHMAFSDDVTVIGPACGQPVNSSLTLGNVVEFGDGTYKGCYGVVYDPGDNTRIKCYMPTIGEMNVLYHFPIGHALCVIGTLDAAPLGTEAS